MAVSFKGAHFPQDIILHGRALVRGLPLQLLAMSKN